VDLLFIVVICIVLFVLAIDLMGAEAMPFLCPRCGLGGGADIAVQPQAWYRSRPRGRVRCRNCGTGFKEHPNGLLVEDR
jgi:hypothetical protein